MAKPIKICRNYCDIRLNRINESAEAGTEKKYIFQGVFTACSTPEKKVINRNGRIYMSHELLKHVSYLRDAIKNQGCILGELDHPDGRFDVSLKEASHKIVDLWYDTKTNCVMGKLILLDTPNGKIAKEIVDAGYPLFVSSRAAGDVDERTKEVEIALLFTYDIVCTPGFEEARLDRVNESMSSSTLKYINESMGAAKKVKSALSIVESDSAIKINENIARYINSPINMNAITKPINEDTEKEFKLPEPETDPNKISNKDESEEVKDESPKKTEKLEDKKDISEKDVEAKEEKRKAILKITAEDEDGNAVNSDNETKSESEQEENRSKILNIYSEEEDETDSTETDNDDTKEAEDEDKDSDEDAEDNEDVQEAIDRKKKVTKEADKTVDELESLLDSVVKTESVKESIIRRYPFAVSLSSTNFGKFAALRPNQKKKCAEFIEEHQIYDINAINELWATPLRQEKKLQQNWLRLASQHDIDLYTMASKDVQDAIEESAKYVVLETQEEVDEFWMRTGLRQAEARRLMNEQFVNTYKTSDNSPYNKDIESNNDPLGYNYDYISMVEQMMKQGF